MSEQEEENTEEKLKQALQQRGYLYELSLGKIHERLRVVQVKDLATGNDKYVIKILSESDKKARYRKLELSVLESEKFAHLNVIEYYDSWSMNIGENSLLYIRMELCRLNLWAFVYNNNIVDAQGDAVIKVEGPTRFYERVFPQILNGLEFIHHIGWVHRNIHPGNILIANPNPNQISDVVVKIADFGFAREIGPIIGAPLSLTDAGKLEMLSPDVGNELFRAPELETGEYDYKEDLYSAGIILYFLSRYLEDKQQWKDEVSAFKDGLRRSDDLYHQDDKTLVDLIQLLMKERKERPTAKEALEMARNLGKHKEANEHAESVPLVGSDKKDETDYGITASLEAGNHKVTPNEYPSPSPTDATTSQERKFAVIIGNEMAGYRCKMTGALTLTNLKAQIESRTGVKAEDQEVLTQTETEYEIPLYILTNEDVEEVFDSNEKGQKKVVIHVSRRGDPNLCS